MEKNSPRCYAIVDRDGAFLTDSGYYGNEKCIPLYTKLGGKSHIETFYPAGYKLRKMKT